MKSPSAWGRSGATVASLLAAAGLALGACGSEEVDPDQERIDGLNALNFEVAEGTQPLGRFQGGSVTPLVKCRDWVEGTVERKQATIIDMREQLSGGGVEEGRPSISDPDAFEVMENACSQDFTSAFHLYKIYYRAAAFNNFDPTDIPTGNLEQDD